MKANKTLIIVALLLLNLIGSHVFASTYPAEAPKNKFKLVIDAGHGGKDPGAIGRFSREKNINLAVAKAFGKLVETNCKDVEVIYTRQTDIFVPLDKRADIANKANADLFISIHTNALPGKVIARGTETYTLGMARAEANLEVAKRENAVILIENDYNERYQGFDPNSSESYIMFEFMQDKYMEQSVNLAKLIQKEFRTTGGRPDKGVHQAGFLVLRQTSMPSVLIELGYISTHDEEAFLNSENGKRKLSESIYNAFIQYRQTYDKRQTSTKKTNAEVPQETAPKEHQKMTQSDIAKLINEEKQPSQDSIQTNTETTQDQLVFKVQILVSQRQLHSGSAQLKGLSPVGFYKENNLYKYTYGDTADYKEAIQNKNKIKKQFKDAFIVAFLNDQKIDLKEAITLYKNKNK